MQITDTRPGIGAAPRRREDRRLLTGQGSYGDDVRFAGQAFAMLARSPHAHAVIRRIDTAAAIAQPGVLAVLTGADYVADGLRPMPHTPYSVSPPDITLTDTRAAPVFLAPHYPLATEKVRFVGEGVALVVAETLAAARDAADLIDIEYDALAAVTDARQAAEPTAPHLWKETSSNVVLDALVGDAEATDAAFAEAAHVVRLETLVPRVTGVPMEPRTALATYDQVTGKLTLYAGGGGVVRPKLDLAHMLGLAPEQIRVVAGDVGGNFGTRNSAYPEFALIAWAARRLRRSVKWTADRTVSFLSDYHGRDLAVTAELALDATGRFLAFRTSNVSNLGAYPISFVPLTKGTELMSSLYHVPVVSARARAVVTNASPTVAYRSAGRPEAMFVIERLIDQACQAHGFDRVALRRQNLIPPEALPYRNPFGMLYDSGLYRKVFDDALALADWQSYPMRKAETEARGLRRGIGTGCYIESASGAPQERTSVVVHPEGHVSVTIGTLSSGQGHETSFPQLISEFLCVSPDRVQLVTGDTDIVTAGGGSHSGRSMRHAGTTIHLASIEIIAKGKRIAAQVMETADADIVFDDGLFRVAGTDRGLDLFAIAVAAATRNDLADDLRGALSATAEVDSRVSSFPYGCHVAEVEVDVDTGVVTLARYTALDDVGRAVNPMILHGQAHGGIAQGMGEALLEQCVYDANGQLLSASFMDYAMPRAADLPMFSTAISEVPSTTHPLGLRGGGEGGISPSLGVIGNAVVDALSVFGVRHIELPASPEKIWRAIRNARGQDAGGQDARGQDTRDRRDFGGY
jgi:aerobic carbon-monoxide dehydrogenase large subunit